MSRAKICTPGWQWVGEELDHNHKLGLPVVQWASRGRRRSRYGIFYIFLKFTICFFFYYHFFILEQYRVTILSVFRLFFASYWTEVLSTFFSLGGGWDREEGKLPLAKFGYLPVLVFGDLRLWRGGTIKRYASSPGVSQIQKETANMNVLVSTSL